MRGGSESFEAWIEGLKSKEIEWWRWKYSLCRHHILLIITNKYIIID